MDDQVRLKGSIKIVVEQPLQGDINRTKENLIITQTNKHTNTHTRTHTHTNECTHTHRERDAHTYTNTMHNINAKTVRLTFISWWVRSKCYSEPCSIRGNVCNPKTLTAVNFVSSFHALIFLSFSKSFQFNRFFSPHQHFIRYIWIINFHRTPRLKKRFKNSPT